MVGVEYGQGKGKGRAVEAKKEGWREGEVKWEDGAVAGMIMGAGVGFVCECCAMPVMKRDPQRLIYRCSA